MAQKRAVPRDNDDSAFPLENYAYSTFKQFSTNPYMFKVNKINGLYIESTKNASGVLGSAVHEALKAYLGGATVPAPADEGDAIVFAHQYGMDYLGRTYDGFIEWSDNIPNREKLNEKFAFCFFGYIKEFPYKQEMKRIIMVEKKLVHRVEVQGRELPIPVCSVPDVVYEDHEDRLKIRDHKLVSVYSDPDKIDAAKLVQAVFNYLTVYAETGRPPYSIIFAEFKTSQNTSGKYAGKPQMREIEMVYTDIKMAFELFYRLYADITDALLGKQVYIPNFDAFYDNEVALIAYISRLDIDEIRRAEFDKEKVENITDFLKKKIQSTGSMKKYLEHVSKKFISASTLNYKDMEIEQRIQMKLAEHGLALEFKEKIVGSAITLYCYEPGIGLKMSKIASYTKDIEQVVEISGIRILAPIPNSGLIGFEVPVKDRKFPTVKPAMDGFNLAIGVDLMGEVVRFDLRDAPHTLVAGSTGAGKSVFINSLIKQLKELPSADAELILMDPKMVELSQFTGGNTREYHCDTMPIHQSLEQLVKTMNMRYKALVDAKVQNLAQYNAKASTPLPFLFCFIDEYGDLITSNYIHSEDVPDGETRDGRPKYKTVNTNISQEISKNILILSQKARAAGIHIILTTQRPSVKIVTGDIKGNFITRVAFKTATATDSEVILDQIGAESLLGKGDMLFMTPAQNSLVRLQGFNL